MLLQETKSAVVFLQATTQLHTKMQRQTKSIKYVYFHIKNPKASPIAALYVSLKTNNPTPNGCPALECEFEV